MRIVEEATEAVTVQTSKNKLFKNTTYVQVKLAQKTVPRTAYNAIVDSAMNLELFDTYYTFYAWIFLYIKANVCMYT
jgi:hypothetical protein